MANVTGYDPSFLGIDLPLPQPVGRTVRTLTYPRFSVLLDPQRRLAAVTGVNIDGGALQDLERTGDWELDPRVPETEQAGPAVYARNDLDRGHLVRRRDPGWGTESQARTATEATFVYPNAAPQAASFNQSKDLWLGLEDHVLAYADATDARVCVFTAPVLHPDDPPYRGIGIPRRFWKIAAWSSSPAGAAPRLAAAAFVLDQSALVDIDDAAAVRPLGGFRTFQAPVAEIARLAGMSMPALEAADVLGAPSARDGDRWRELATVGDVTLG